MKTLTHPHYTVAPVVETIFIDGFLFEICEFNTELARKEFGINKLNRYFLVIEGKYFMNDILEEKGNLIGDDIWSWYCKDKQHIKVLISEFEQKLESIEKWENRALKIKDGKYNSPQIIADKIKDDLKKRYGVHLK